MNDKSTPLLRGVPSMALDDVPLEDAGRDYYARKFGDRVQNVRKYGAPPRNTGGRGSGWAAGAGVVALLVVIRIVIAVVVGVGGSDSSSYNSYSPNEAYDPPPIDWNQGGASQPWQDQPLNRLIMDPPDGQPEDPAVPPGLLDNVDPDQQPPVVPDDDRKRPDKDD
jgi:hypothetical protein